MTVPSERPTPAEAMEWLEAVRSCPRCTLVSALNGAAGLGRTYPDGCPDCALLLYRAIASRVEAQQDEALTLAHRTIETLQRAFPAQREDATPTPERDVKLGEFCECYKRFGGNCPCSRWTPGAAPPSAPSPEVSHD